MHGPALRARGKQDLLVRKIQEGSLAMKKNHIPGHLNLENDHWDVLGGSLCQLDTN